MALAGCVVDPASCDPNQLGNVLTSAMRSRQGQFDARQANLGGNLDTILAEVERERIAISRANTRLRQLRAEQRLSSAQASQISREIAALDADVNRLPRTSGNPAAAARPHRPAPAGDQFLCRHLGVLAARPRPCPGWSRRGGAARAAAGQPAAASPMERQGVSGRSGASVL